MAIMRMIFAKARQDRAEWSWSKRRDSRPYPKSSSTGSFQSVSELPTVESVARFAPLSLSFPLRTRCHKDQYYQILGCAIPNAMFLAWPCDDGLARTKFLLFACNVERSSASKNKVDLVRFRMSVNPLILPRFQAIEIAEVRRRVEQWYLLHLVIRKTDEMVDSPGFHKANRFRISG